MQHLARDHDIHRAGEQGKRAAVREHQRERVGALDVASGRGSGAIELDADEAERDPMPPGGDGRRSRDVPEPGPNVEKGPGSTRPPSPPSSPS